MAKGKNRGAARASSGAVAASPGPAQLEPGAAAPEELSADDAAPDEAELEEQAATEEPAPEDRPPSDASANTDREAEPPEVGPLKPEAQPEALSQRDCAGAPACPTATPAPDGEEEDVYGGEPPVLLPAPDFTPGPLSYDVHVAPPAGPHIPHGHVRRRVVEQVSARGYDLDGHPREAWIPGDTGHFRPHVVESAPHCFRAPKPEP